MALELKFFQVITAWIESPFNPISRFVPAMGTSELNMRFCPYVNRMLLLAIAPFALWFTGFMLENAEVYGLAVWLALAALTAIITWCTWYTCFALSPSESWGQVLRLRLAYWPRHRKRSDTYRQSFYLLGVLPCWMALCSLAALNLLDWCRLPENTPSAIKAISLDRPGIAVACLVLSAVVFCMSVILVARLIKIRSKGEVRCLDCGNRLAGEDARRVDRCLECGSHGSGSHRLPRGKPV